MSGKNRISPQNRWHEKILHRFLYDSIIILCFISIALRPSYASSPSPTANPNTAESIFALSRTENENDLIIDRPVSLKTQLKFKVPIDPESTVQTLTLTLTSPGTSCHQVISQTPQLVDNGEAIYIDLSNEDVLPSLYRQYQSSSVLLPMQVVIYDRNHCLGRLKFCLYDPTAPVQLPQCDVRLLNGANTPFINNKPEGSLASYLAAYVSKNGNPIIENSVSDFADAGIQVFEIKIHNIFPYWRPDQPFDTEGLYRDIEQHVLKFILESPKSYYLISWYLYVPEWWLERYPDEIIRLDDGSRYLHNTPGHILQPSYASPHWREQMGTILKQFLLRLKHSPIADRFTGIQLAYGNCGEWNNWGYHEETFPDYSLVMQKAFSNWLKTTYKTETNLRKAWDDPTARFTDKAVPTRTQRMKESIGVFRQLPQAMRVVDFYTFWQDTTVNTINYFAKIAKQATDHRSLVGSYYGYFVGHHGNAPYHFQDCGHFALKTFLDSPWLDFAGGPYPYAHRRKNCAINGVFSSFRLSDKFWYSEDDQRTHYSGTANARYGTTNSLDESIAIAQRDFIINLSKGSSYYFYDFLQGWYRDPLFMDAVKRLKQLDTFALDDGRQSRAHIALFVSEESIPYLSNQCNSVTVPFRNMILWDLDAAGAPWDFFLLSDLDKVDLSAYKLVILPNAFRISSSEQKNIRQRLYGNNRTVIYLYAPALMTDHGFDIKQAADLTGIQLAVDDSAGLYKLESAITGFDACLEYPDRILPLVYVNDPDANALGYVNGTSRIGFAEKRYDDYTVLYLSAPSLNRKWLRYLYDQSGVHIYSRTDDMFYIAGHICGLYSRNGGIKEIEWPHKMDVIYDLIQNTVLANNTNHLEFSLPDRPVTRIFYAGPQKPMP